MSDLPSIGLDLGGTDLKAVLLDPAGSIVRAVKHPSRTNVGRDAPIDAVVEAVRELERRSPELAAIGLGVPGAIDVASGSLIGTTPHLPHWRDFPVRERLVERLGFLLHVENDANCAAIAEHRLGAARGSRISVTVTVGTGVGAGIVVDGRLLRGAHGGAGEVGHLPLGADGPACACGVTGCAEPVMSGEGLEREARERGLGAVNATGVFALARAGNPKAIELIDRLCDRLGAAIAAVVQLVDPDLVVVGGGVAGAGQELLVPLREALDRYVMLPHRNRLRIVPAELGELAGAVGAALCAREASLAPGPYRAARTVSGS